MDAHQLGALIEATVGSGESFWLLATGNSMFPFLRSRVDRVKLVSLGGRPPRPGDILLFRRTASSLPYALHRVWRVKKDGKLLMNGDSQGWTEEISPSQVIALATRRQRGEKILSLDSPLYRLRVWLWGLTRPFRYPLSLLYLKIFSKEKSS